MKIQHLIPILFLAAFCTVSAQTNTPTAPALLTTNQVTALATQLANDKYIKDNPGPKQPKFVTSSQRYAAVHWRWDGFWIPGLCFATVELASDGSTNSVVLRYDNGLGFP